MERGALSLAREPQPLEATCASPVTPHPPPNFFSLRRRSCKCFVAASSCFLWKPGVPACTDPVLGGCTPPSLCVNGASPSCPACTPPQFRGLEGQWPCSPLGGACAPRPGDSVPGTLPHRLFLPGPVGHPPTLVSRLAEPGRAVEGAGPSCWAGLYIC